jgi:hypothetical protein
MTRAEWWSTTAPQSLRTAPIMTLTRMVQCRTVALVQKLLCDSGRWCSCLGAFAFFGRTPSMLRDNIAV